MSDQHHLNCLSFIVGERLEDSEVDEIIRLTDINIDLDGNLKYDGES